MTKTKKDQTQILIISHIAAIMLGEEKKRDSSLPSQATMLILLKLIQEGLTSGQQVNPPL